MDISSLVEAIYDDLNASLTTMQWLDARALVMTLECDDWSDLKRRRRFELKCIEPVEVRCSLGVVGSIGHFLQHPLLLEHAGPHAQLFFSSAPESPGEVYLAAHAAISSVLDGWRDPQQTLCHSPATFGDILAGGHGLMAFGPTSVIGAIEQRVSSMLRVNTIPSHVRNSNLVALTIDTDYVICESVEVAEVGS